MALYRDDKRVLRAKEGPAWEKIWKPGETPDFAGIYRCEGCGDEIASNKSVRLPTQNHRQHSPNQGDIRWRLLVATQPGN